MTRKTRTRSDRRAVTVLDRDALADYTYLEAVAVALRRAIASLRREEYPAAVGRNRTLDEHKTPTRMRVRW
jgi:hypothetical protein